jgi:hypothetical protein
MIEWINSIKKFYVKNKMKIKMIVKSKGVPKIYGNSFVEGK